MSLHFWCSVLWCHLLRHQGRKEIRQHAVFPVADGSLSLFAVLLHLLVLNIQSVVPRSHATELVLVEFLQKCVVIITLSVIKDSYNCLVGYSCGYLVFLKLLPLDIRFLDLAVVAPCSY
jgi:hypothetical protein